jgi:hypothetical protein
MKAEWTSATPSVGKVTIGDDSVKHTMVLEALGLAGEEQMDNLAFGTVASRLMRGNVAGDCVLTSGKSHASLDAAASYFATEAGRIGNKGLLELTFNTHKLSLDNATLKGVQRVEGEGAAGVRWKLRYTFGIVTVAYS